MWCCPLAHHICSFRAKEVNTKESTKKLLRNYGVRIEISRIHPDGISQTNRFSQDDLYQINALHLLAQEQCETYAHLKPSCFFVLINFPILSSIFASIS